MNITKHEIRTANGVKLRAFGSLADAEKAFGEDFTNKLSSAIGVPTDHRFPWFILVNQDESSVIVKSSRKSYWLFAKRRLLPLYCGDDQDEFVLREKFTVFTKAICTVCHRYRQEEFRDMRIVAETYAYIRGNNTRDRHRYLVLTMLPSHPLYKTFLTNFEMARQTNRRFLFRGDIDNDLTSVYSSFASYQASPGVMVEAISDFRNQMPNASAPKERGYQFSDDHFIDLLVEDYAGCSSDSQGA